MQIEQLYLPFCKTSPILAFSLLPKILDFLVSHSFLLIYLSSSIIVKKTKLQKDRI